jgi:hypothetical protein
MKEKPKILTEGDQDRADDLQDVAKMTLSGLKRDMAFQGLPIGMRRLETPDGDIIECRSAHGQDIVSITSPEIDSDREDVIRIELWCSNGEPVTKSRLSYIVLYVPNPDRRQKPLVAWV